MEQSTCRKCQKTFVESNYETELREKLNVVVKETVFTFPASKDCPSCRHLLRNMFMNERNLYYRTCDKTGKTIVSNYAPDSPYTVYYAAYWLSDDWDATEYAQELNFDEPFFVQFQRLFKQVPRMSIDQATVENSDFNNHVDNLKDCYMCVQGGGLEGCTYCTYAQKSTNCHDCYYIDTCESCYSCVHCTNCHEVFFSTNVRNSANSMFLKNCSSMRDSMFCVNMAHKEFCIWNKQHTKNEYEKERKLLLERMQAEPGKVWEEFEAFAQRFPQPAAFNFQTENSVGDYLQNCKDCTDVYIGIDSENVHHAVFPVKNKDCMDVFGMHLQHSYYSFAGGPSYNCHFCFAVWENCKDVHYSDYCFFDCEALFGCVGLKRKKYCILNKQYTKEEYESLLPKLIAHMQKTGEWGEWFPVHMTPFAYNESQSFVYAPLTENEARAKGYRWRSIQEQGVYEGPQVVLDSIETYRDSRKAQELLLRILTCNATKQAYRVIPQELAFCIAQGLPVPRYSPRQRYLSLLARMNPMEQKEACCMNQKRYDTGCPCENGIVTSLSVEKDIVYCEECYREAIV